MSEVPQVVRGVNGQPDIAVGATWRWSGPNLETDVQKPIQQEPELKAIADAADELHVVILGLPVIDKAQYVQYREGNEQPEIRDEVSFRRLFEPVPVV